MTELNLPPLTFQSTRPSRDGTPIISVSLILHSDFNPPVPRGTGQHHQAEKQRWSAISIHPSLAGRDNDRICLCLSHFGFQSTRPSRDGTSYPSADIFLPLAISIHPSLAGRDGSDIRRLHGCRYFNPPVPRGTGPLTHLCPSFLLQFQSTRPSRDGTLIRSNMDAFLLYFNPPVPRGTGRLCGQALQNRGNFNPPVPRGTGHTWTTLAASSG